MTALQPAEGLERRVRRLEDRIEIGELIARYGLVMDDRDIARMPTLFTPDVQVRSLDGVMNASGRDAVVEMFHRRIAAIGPSNHVTHDHTRIRRRVWSCRTLNCAVAAWQWWRLFDTTMFTGAMPGSGDFVSESSDSCISSMPRSMWMPWARASLSGTAFSTGPALRIGRSRLRLGVNFSVSDRARAY